MKRIILILVAINLSLLFFLTPTTTMARAGGSMGSSGSTTSSSDTSDSGYDNYRGYRGYNNYGNNRFSMMDVVIIGFIGFSFLTSVRRNRRKNFKLPETYDELTPQLNDCFEPFFYQVEDAWTKNDLATLRELMSPFYFTKQKRIINGYIRQHKIDQLDGLVIIDLQQVVTSSDQKMQVIVTAQARDYFQYDNKTTEYNQQIQEDTNIERFQEIWTLTWKDETNLQLCNIKTI
ncbi:TIM44-like domain-containing protein [Companilactobacillus zhachilii]|uniref:TIM44-like domain-containing protein n=1 Tax=Companilactobacillus zhachilii TaxID=2304606 RepID=UPI004034A30F